MNVLSLQALLNEEKTTMLNTRSVLLIVLQILIFLQIYKRKASNCYYIVENESSLLKKPLKKTSAQKVGSFGVDEMAFNNHRRDYYRVIPLHRLRCNGMAHVPSITELNGKNVFTRARVRCVVTGDINFSLHAT